MLQAQDSDLLVPLSRCLRALLERLERGREAEEEPEPMASQEEGRVPASAAGCGQGVPLLWMREGSRETFQHFQGSYRKGGGSVGQDKG